ncbi:MAG: type I-E CRISPR-associated protein Cse1/CasA [Proteobacteria bacterium]|nr:type I-E CRISPR-associated protein Cse1/CasA [Pseudomonadota bacterium]
MNLVTDPWLPATDIKNRLRHISLNQLFERPEEWIDLVLKPHERVSVMRLLICIVQASLDGPANIDEWNESLTRIPEAGLKYLEIWKPWFNLYDKNRPFLQIKSLKPGNDDKSNGPPVAKLDSTLAVGENAATLFDHGAAASVSNAAMERKLTDKQIVISLLTFLNYSPSGTQSSARLDGELIKHNSGAMDAPCINQNMLHTFVVKETLIKTIHANVIDKELVEEFYGENSWGRPVWELASTLSLKDKQMENNSVETYLGRLTPLSRFCKLQPNSPYFIYCKGFQYSTKPKKKTDSKRVYVDFSPEPSSTVIVDSKGNYSLLKSGVNIPWREITALIANREKKSLGGALPLRYLNRTESCDLVVLGQTRDPENAAKVLDLIDSRIHIPAYMMSKHKQEVYESNIKICQDKSYELFRAVEKYRVLLDDEWKGLVKRVLEKKTTKHDRKQRYLFRQKATNHYWTLIETQRHLLAQYIFLLDTDHDQEREGSKKKWHDAIQYAAKETYRILCSQGSPRQMKAYVWGWRILNRSES